MKSTQILYRMHFTFFNSHFTSCLSIVYILCNHSILGKNHFVGCRSISRPLNEPNVLLNAFVLRAFDFRSSVAIISQPNHTTSANKISGVFSVSSPPPPADYSPPPSRSCSCCYQCTCIYSLTTSFASQ